MTMMEKNWSLEHLLRIFKRNWWHLILLTLLGIAAGYLASQRLQVTYSSDTLIMVKPQGFPTSKSEVTIDDSIRKRIANIKDRVLSRSRLVEIIKKHDLYSQELANTSWDHVVNKMRKSTQIDIFASVFRISYSGKDNPERIMRTTDELAAMFIEENLRYKQSVYAAHQFMQKRVEEEEKKLQQMEEKIAAYKRKHLGNLPENLQANFNDKNSTITLLNANAQMLTQVEGEKRILAKEFLAGIEQALAKLKTLYYQKKLSTFPSKDGETTQSVLREYQQRHQELQARLLKLRDRLRHLLTEYTEAYPDVKQTKEQIGLLEKQLKELKAPKNKKLYEQEEIYAYSAAARRNIKKNIIACIKLKRYYLQYLVNQAQVSEQVANMEAAAQMSSQLEKKLALLLEQSNKLEQVVFDFARTALKNFPELLQISKQFYQLQLRSRLLYKKRQMYQRDLQMYEERIRQTPNCEQQLAQMKMEYQNAIKTYETVLKNNAQAKLLSDLAEQRRGGEFTILDPAYLPKESNLKMRIFCILAGLGAGFALSIGIAIQRDLLFSRIEDRETLQKLTRKNVFLSVPRFRMRLTKMQPIPANSDANPESLLELEPVAHLTTFFAPASAIANTYRKLRFQLFNRKAGEKPPTKILFTSVSPGDGKTTTSFNIAGAIATGLADKVIWIDCNLASPLHKGIKNDSGRGLADALADLSTTPEPLAVEETVQPEQQISDNDVRRVDPTSGRHRQFERLQVKTARKKLSKRRRSQLLRNLTEGEINLTTSATTVTLCEANGAPRQLQGQRSIPMQASGYNWQAAKPDHDSQAATPVVRQTQFERLQILPAGKTHLNPSELLSSAAMAKLVEDLSRKYPEHILLFDGPAILSTTDITSLAALVDKIVVVVKAHRTSPKLLKKALDLIDIKQIAGFILNGVDSSEIKNA